MRIAMTGSTGLIGSRLVRHLTQSGCKVTRIVRGPTPEGVNTRVLRWQPDCGWIDRDRLEGHDVIIHLAGENIAAGRWTNRRKQRILYSRREGTRLLCEALAGLKHPPQTLLSASAVGYYGNKASGQTVTEADSAGEGFLAQVSREWEQSTLPAQEAGIRVVQLRFGMVLSREGGALAAMLPVFRLGIGGRLGRGDQMMSWIALDEIPSAVDFILKEEHLSGPINMVAPHCVTNREFTRALGRVLRRPTLFALPAPVARLALGEIAESLLLKGCPVVPQRLTDAGYRFRWPDLEAALRHQLKAE